MFVVYFYGLLAHSPSHYVILLLFYFFFLFSLQCLAVNTHEYTEYVIKQPIKQDEAY